MSSKRNTELQRAQQYSAKVNASGMQRGQIDPQFILGAFVLIVIAGPLVAVGVDIQSELASTSAFSWFSGGVIAILIVAAMVAAALGLD